MSSRRSPSRGPRDRPTGTRAGAGPAATAVPAAARALASPWFLVAVLVLGAALRIAYLAAFRRTPLFDHLQLDHHVYDAWGWRIAGGDWLGTKLVRLYESMVADERYRSDPAVWRKLEGMYRAVGRGADADRVAARARP